MKFVILLVVIVAVIAIAQMMRVYELASKLRNKREEHIPRRYNEMNALFMLLFMIIFYGGFIWLMIRYGDGGLGVAASEHGAEIDSLLNLNFAIIIAIFFLTNTLLFYFSFKYYHRPGKKAFFYPHNNRLELIWTVIPAIVLAVIIILGLKTWNNIMSNPSDDAVVVELYSKQFDWTARYSGEDNVLGHADYKLIGGMNALGVITSETIDARMAEINDEMISLKGDIDDSTKVFTDAVMYEMETKLERLGRIKNRIIELAEDKKEHIDSINILAYDDFIVKGEMHLKVNQEYYFVFRSQDVIHSAYFPHFRAQMNTVPGMRTTFKFKPTITTAEMREKKNDSKFDYVLLCNKICGTAHSNMQMKIVVDNEEEYNKWVSEQKLFVEIIESMAEENTAETVSEEETVVAQN